MSHSQQYIETLNQWGLLLAVAIYGAHVTLFLYSLKRVAQRTEYRLLCYVVLLFILATVGIALQITWTQVAFIRNRDYPGGPNQFLLDHVDSNMNRAVTAVYVVLNWLADGIIFYRFYVLCVRAVAYGKWRVAFMAATAAPSAIALIVVGIKFFPKIEGLGVNLWTDASVAPGIAYMALSLSINTTLTISIIARLLIARRQLSNIMGRENPSQTYITAVAALIESAALYTVYALLAVIACGTNSPMQYVLLPALGQLQTIPPLLITSRLTDGSSWAQEHYGSTFQASSPSPTTTMKISLPSPLPKLRTQSGVMVEVERHIASDDTLKFMRDSIDRELERGHAF